MEVTHNWSDEQWVKLLKNCYDAIPANGKVILVELVLPEGPDYAGVATQNALSKDLMMMCFTQGGKERTETEFEKLAMDAGFNDFKKAACAYNYWIMELRK
ncbi:O-methyltransferase family protein [Striga asiatica]|uniref:O-methyltransferase family protein n=1 Tax=Striga asiatica TaxID=4170 RepID=A0A5A7PH94_STRAF|nr:O-methyltransferase family protein [Striga asiatica]